MPNESTLETPEVPAVDRAAACSAIREIVEKRLSPHPTNTEITLSAQWANASLGHPLGSRELSLLTGRIITEGWDKSRAKEPPRDEGVWRLTNQRGAWDVKIAYIMDDWHGQYLINGELVGAWCPLRWWPMAEYGTWEKQNDKADSPRSGG